jgi:secreted PhoX family phosphatase
MGKIIDMRVSGLQRRGFLGYMGGVPLALSGSTLLSLTACGGGASSGSDPAYPTKITFIASSSPATDADKAKVFTDAKITVTYSDKSVQTPNLAYKEIYRTGTRAKSPAGADVLIGGYYKPDGVTPINDSTGTTPEQYCSDCVDGQSLLKLANPTVSGVAGNVVFLVTQFEYKSVNNAGTSMYGRLPSPISISTLDQNKTTGELKLKYYYNVPTASVNGLWITCGSSVSPWNTHLSSEEYEPDAWFVKMMRDSGTTSIASLSGWSASQLSNLNGSLDFFQSFSTNTFGNTAAANPYHYGHVPEVTVNSDGTGSIKKHYCLGRISRELVQVMPDQKTVLMGDDYVGGAFYMFIANTAGDLSAGTLYAAKLTQTDAVKPATNGGSFTFKWIKLGSASSAEIKTAADTLSVNQIIDVKFTATDGYTALTLDGGGTQYVKVLPGREKEAAFLETHRYSHVMGATMETTKLEGVTVNVKDKTAYYAMSRLDSPFGDSAGDIQHSALRPGAVYASPLKSGQTDSSGAAINSDWVPTSAAVPEGLLGQVLSPTDSDGNAAVKDKIAQPDNVKYSEALRTLFIGEDGTGHLNNYVWAYNVDTKALTRVLSVPAGAECTGLQPVDNLNGFSYVMSAMQHVGDWSWNSTQSAAGGLKEKVAANWGGLMKQSANGYVALPVIK